jgi:ABC-type amino acid transport system permease subunit
MLRAAAAAVAIAALAVGFGSTTAVRTGTVACSTNSFAISFDPKQRAVVTSSGQVLATASFTSRSLGSSCRRVSEPKRFSDGGLGAEIRRAISFRCAASQPIRIHVNPITNEAGDKIVGSSLSVGIGTTNLRVIASAVLKNRGDPYASRVYRARSYCKLGAR